MKHSTHDETERTREDDPGLAVKFVPTLPHGMVTIGEVARRVVVRALAAAVIEKGPTREGGASLGAGSYTMGEGGGRARGENAPAVSGPLEGVGHGSDKKIR